MSEQVTFGRYVLERRIATGGMGEVFLAHQTGPSGFARRCVVKKMHPHLEADAETSAMFLEEAQLTASINHPHVAQVYDFGRVGTAFYLAMEYVDGPPLLTVVKHYKNQSKFVPLDFICRVLSQASQALDYVHRMKGPDGRPMELIHRDISPQNLLVSCDGVTKVIDFGIAKARTTAPRTQVGLVRGKIGYLSPEQLEGLSLDSRTDIYAMGMVMYEMVTGRRAVLGNNDIEMLANIRGQSWPSADRLRPDLPRELLDVLAKATETNREHRYQTMAALSDALEAVIAKQGGWSPTPQRLGAIATEVIEDRSKKASGFDAATDTDLSATAAARALAVTAPVGLSPWQVPTHPAREAVARPAAGRGLLIAVVLGLVFAVLTAGVMAFMARRPVTPDVKMPAPGPPPVVKVAPPDAGNP